VKKYDFCTGEGKHKELFTDAYKSCADVFYFPLTPRYIFIVASKLIYDSAMDVLKFLVKRLGKTERIKKVIRSNAG